MNTQNKKNNRNKGFSLVEMLVAVGIFMSIMTISITSLISIIGANKKAQAIKSTIDSVTFGVENISRDMRIGTDFKCSQDNIDFFTACLDASNNNIGGAAVRYISNMGIATKYYFLNGELVRYECTSDFSSCPTSAYLISAESGAKITDMKFYVIGADCEFGGASCPQGKTQPRVVITTSGLISVKGSSDTSFNLQTNISQRIRR